MRADLRWLHPFHGEEAEAFAGLVGRFWEEIIPGERPVPLSELRARVEHGDARRQGFPLLAVVGGEPVGTAMLFVDALRPQRASLGFLFVAPEHRGQGLGTRLLDAAGERARAAGRCELRTLIVEGREAAAAFAARAGGRQGLVLEQSRCPVASLDRAMLEGWVARAGERAAGYSLVAFDGVCPDEHLEAFTAVVPVMTTAPQADRTEVVAPSPEEVRRSMEDHVNQGNDSWTLCARDDATGRFVGYTELSFSHHRPWHATQGDTGVDPVHRGRGLGRWLKAEAALRLLDERSEVEHIETWNAATNQAMLSINRAMGFRVVVRWRELTLPCRSGDQGGDAS